MRPLGLLAALSVSYGLSMSIATAESLRLYANISGAKVFIEGDYWGRTSARKEKPLIIHDISPGSHKLKVIKDGYFPVSRQIVIAPGVPNAVELFLIKIKHAL